MSVQGLPESWLGRRVNVLDALLHGRQHILVRHALWFVTGIEAVDSLYPFIQGWLANTHLNGGAELAWQEFLEWYRQTQGEALGPEWHIHPLQQHHGDDEKAALVLLDRVAEYVEMYGVFPRGKAGAMDAHIAATYGALPREWGGRPVEMLDALLWFRQRMRDGQRLSFLTGSETVDSLFCFTIGWNRNTIYNHHEDLTVEPFRNWLRDEKKEFPGEGWHVKYLQDCGGDHRRAVQKFLDLAAEFKASR